LRNNFIATFSQLTADLKSNSHSSGNHKRISARWARGFEVIRPGWELKLIL
jgi:hypothetical protein